MKRRTFLGGLTAASALVAAGSSALAATFAEDVVGQLTRQGFTNIGVETTWLGRVRIVAERADGHREIILNPRTGEILRDTWQAAGDAASKPIIDDIADKTASNGDKSGSDTSGSGGSGSDGSGTGGSGSGGSGSDGSGSGGSGSDGSGSGGSGSDGSGGDSGGGGSGGGGGSDGSGHGGDDKGGDKGGKGK